MMKVSLCHLSQIPNDQDIFLMQRKYARERKNASPVHKNLGLSLG